MPKPRRKENKGLPARWRYNHGAYSYRVPPGQEAQWDGKREFKLGRTLPEAYANWAKRIQTQGEVRTIGDLLDEYALRVIPTKKPKTRESNKHALKPLRLVFERMSILDIKPRHVYQYAEARSTKQRNDEGRLTGGRTAALREVEVLSHSFTKAVEWGLLDKHPFKNEVRLKGVAPRTRYVEDWEIVECLSLESRRKRGSVLAIQGYIRLKLLTGLRGIDLLRLRLDDLRDDGIHVQPSKTETTTAKKLIFDWTPERRAAVAMCKEARPVPTSEWLFCNRDGACYVDAETDDPPGWKSMWQRFMARVLAETEVKVPFTAHDLRAKAGSDADSLERARQLLGHADAAITARVYRRRPERIA